MLTLAVAHREETFERIEEPLRDRGIEVEPISITSQTTPIGEESPDPGGFDAGFVFPGRIMEGGVLDALLDVPWVNDREAVLRSRNKAGTLTRLAEADLPVPKTVLVSNPVEEDAVREAFERFEPPVVVKPNSTTRGNGVLQVSEVDSLLGATDYLDLLHEFPATGDRSYLIQEAIETTRDYRVMLLEGEFVGAVERSLPEDERDRGRWKRNVHRGATAEGVTPPPPVTRLAERAAEAMDIPLLGVDILVSPEKTVVTETNARPTIDREEKYVGDFYDRLTGLIERTATGR
ncbi:MAG: RimK family alpha-L-glutamate ligase [Halodesulfurarchaeum sp.]